MRVVLKDITKSFGAVRANDGISLEAESGAIHGILGENGAGKSTLMKILSGFYTPDRGEVLIDGRPVRSTSPAEAIAAGIGMLHQDPLDVPRLSVLENFLLGAPGGFALDRAAGHAALVGLDAEFGFGLDPRARAGDLSIGQRQQLEIARLLWLGVSVLILDEPTTAISPPQRRRLFAALRAMAAQGKVVFLVSHKLEEMQALCNRVTVLRHGRVAGEAAMPVDTRHLVRLMFGRDSPDALHAAGAPGAPPAAPAPFAAKHVPYAAEHVPSAPMQAPSVAGPAALELVAAIFSDPPLTLGPMSLTVGAGEVIGLAGLEGSGQRVFLQGCAGVARIAGGVRIGGRTMPGPSYREFLAAGVAYLPAGRLDEGLIRGFTLTEHVALMEAVAPRGRPWIDWPRASRTAAARIGAFRIRGTPRSCVEELSGGNQQRALLALLPDEITLLLMEHPTRGLDLESAEEIWRHLLARRDRGTALVFASSDLDELLERSDRILVFSGGAIAGPVDARGATGEQLGELVGGAG